MFYEKQVYYSVTSTCDSEDVFLRLRRHAHVVVVMHRLVIWLHVHVTAESQTVSATD